jgi:hypothetical protein
MRVRVVYERASRRSESSFRPLVTLAFVVNN